MIDTTAPTLSAARRLGLLGGTFDPIHYGHLLTAEEAAEQFALDAVVFIPNGRPVHKPGGTVGSPDDRYRMCEIATRGNRRFHCSRIEIDRNGPSYSIDTLAAFRAWYPRLDAMYFIAGADAILDLPTWHRAGEIDGFCEFIAATRPGSDLSRVGSAVGPNLARLIHFMSIPGTDISSTDLRSRIAEGRSIRYQTPDAVVRYIEENRLYAAAAVPGTAA